MCVCVFEDTNKIRGPTKKNKTVSSQFCCEPKTALKNSVLKKKWQAYTFSKHEEEPLFLSSNGGIS